MDSRTNKRTCCPRTVVYLKATCSIIGLLAISTLLWIVGCEIVWHGTLRIEDVYKTKERFYIYQIISFVFFIGLGIIIIIVSVSLVLLGIPFMVVHVEYLFNRRQIQISDTSTIENDELRNKNSEQALKWTISILILVIVGLTIGGAGCEVMQWSGIKFRAVVKNKNEANKLRYYLKQCSFLVVMFAGLLLSFFGLLLAPFTLAFAGVVSFDKKRNSYRLRPRRRRRRQQSRYATSKV